MPKVSKRRQRRIRFLQRHLKKRMKARISLDTLQVIDDHDSPLLDTDSLFSDDSTRGELLSAIHNERIDLAMIQEINELQEFSETELETNQDSQDESRVFIQNMAMVRKDLNGRIKRKSVPVAATNQDLFAGKGSFFNNKASPPELSSQTDFRTKPNLLRGEFSQTILCRQVPI